MTKPNVVSAANDEELTGAARQVSGEAAPASGSAPKSDRPLAGGAVLTTLRAPCLFLHSKVVTLRVPCLFLMQCKAEYKTHVRIEGGDESPHSKDASRRRSKRSASCRGGRSTGRKQYGKCISRFCSSDILAVVLAGVKTIAAMLNRNLSSCIN